MIFAIILILFVTTDCYRLSRRENELLQKTCGVGNLGSSSRLKIFGGRAIKPGEYPWMVKLRADVGIYRTVIQNCSASLISPRHILTAAHCATSAYEHEMAKECNGPVKKKFVPPEVKPKVFIVYVGTRCNPPEKCKITHEVSKVFVDKKWKWCEEGKDYMSSINRHDFAILELSKEVSNKKAIPICLPRSKMALAKEFQIAGSGWERRGMEGPGYKVATIPLVKEDNRGVFLAPGKTTAICPGDSGGPLFQLNGEGRYVVLGVSSGGLHGPHDCSSPVALMFFGDVRKSLDWICQITGVCPDGEPPKKQPDASAQKLLEGLKKLIAKIGNAGRDVVEKIRDFLEKAMKLIQG